MEQLICEGSGESSGVFLVSAFGITQEEPGCQGAAPTRVVNSRTTLLPCRPARAFVIVEYLFLHLK